MLKRRKENTREKGKPSKETAGEEETRKKK